MKSHSVASKFHRQQFLNGECSQIQYYEQFITPDGVDRVQHSITFQNLKMANPTKRTEIPLSGWDFIGTAVDIPKLLIEVGDHWSLATSVVINKTIAAHLLGIQS